MDSFEWNKVAGGVLGTVLFVMVVRVATEAVFHVEPPAKMAYVVEGVQQAPKPEAPKPKAEPLPEFAKAIPMADAQKGMTIAMKCGVCHDWTKGGPNKVGPNLYGIIGRERASHPGFDYSAAMKNKPGNWTYAALFTYLKSPAMFVPGNKMAFPGLPSAQDRLDLLAYMRTWADSPPPLPSAADNAAGLDTGTNKGGGDGN